MWSPERVTPKGIRIADIGITGFDAGSGSPSVVRLKPTKFPFAVLAQDGRTVVTNGIEVHLRSRDQCAREEKIVYGEILRMLRRKRTDLVPGYENEEQRVGIKTGQIKPARSRDSGKGTRTSSLIVASVGAMEIGWMGARGQRPRCAARRPPAGYEQTDAKNCGWK
jgi:hypothetical protein